VNVKQAEYLNTETESKTNQIINIKTSNNQNNVFKSKSLTTIESIENSKEHLLSKVMKRCLSDVLHEGLLDSVLPYMLPKHVLSQPFIKKALVMDSKKTSFISNDIENCLISTITDNKEKDKNKLKKNME
jgi:hypothetical protein